MNQCECCGCSPCECGSGSIKINQGYLSLDEIGYLSMSGNINGTWNSWHEDDVTLTVIPRKKTKVA